MKFGKRIMYQINFQAIKKIFKFKPSANPDLKGVFIIGCPRSGTTLLYNLLAQTNLFAFPYIYNQQKQRIPREGTDIWWRALGKKRGELEGYLSKREVDLITKAYSLIKNEFNRDLVLDKVLFMSLWLREVKAAFPNMKLIHIVRDGRAVINSMLFKYRYSEKKEDRIYREGKEWFGPKPKGWELFNNKPLALRCVWQWVEIVTRCKNDGCFFFGENYFEVKYEDLVSNTQKVLKEVFKFIGLKNIDRLLDLYPQNFENRNYKLYSPERKFKDGFTVRRAILEKDQPYIEFIGPYLRQWGYS